MTIAPVKFIFATLFSLGGASTTAILYDNTEKAIAAERETEKDHCVDGFFKNASNSCDISSIENQATTEVFIEKLNEQSAEARDYRINIAEQWKEQSKKLPNSFFKKYSKNFMVKEPGVCHMKVFNVVVDSEKQTLHIPFKKDSSPLKTKNLWGQIGVPLPKSANEQPPLTTTDTSVHRSSIVGNRLNVTENGANLIAKLTKLAQKSHPAQEALFLVQLYQTTMDRLLELSNTQEVIVPPSGSVNYLWEYDEDMCGVQYKIEEKLSKQK